MGKIQFTDGIGIPHSSFEKEFLTHKQCSEWWYCTGYLNDEEDKRLFGYQFTLAKVKIWGVHFHILICSVTDFAEQKHYNIQTPIFFGKGITANDQVIFVDNKIRLTFSENACSSMGRMTLHMESSNFILDTQMEAVKAPVWHCEDGALQMGIQNDPKERTYYYSFTNLKTSGKLVLNGKMYTNLTGKTWFDRQGGTFSLTKRECSWEWFSLRFFDNSEAMLFAFPHMNYYDGTRVYADGSYRRMNDYRIKATKEITYNGMKFSSEWTLTMEGKNYTLVPKVDGMFNVFFFELLAGIRDEDGNEVGYCFVELLPGVRNPDSLKVTMKAFVNKK